MRLSVVARQTGASRLRRPRRLFAPRLHLHRALEINFKICRHFLKELALPPTPTYATRLSLVSTSTRRIQ